MFDRGGSIAELEAAVNEVFESEMDVSSPQAAHALINEVEVLRRRLASAQARVFGAVDESGVFRSDGHPSATAMVRHCGRLSGSSGAARMRGSRIQLALPLVADALAEGELGVDQFDLLGRVHANPRVRDAMWDAQDWFLEVAKRLSYRDFELEVRQWERLVDDDGPEPANSRAHETRNVRLVQDHFSLSWEMQGGFGAGQGAQISEIYERYIDAERLADWEKARAEHGEDVTAQHLPRTESQRRADALWQVFQDAAGSGAGTVPVDFVHNVVWDHATFGEMVRRLSGETPRPLDPETYRCETIDGIPLEPVEAAANALLAKFRRVVVDSAGVVLDLGRARTFTGGARLAVQLADGHCPWPGCEVRSSRCEIDHSFEHARGGATRPDNGGTFCGRHNRWKQKGFSVWRDPAGEWHVYRPDGSEIE